MTLKKSLRLLFMLTTVFTLAACDDDNNQEFVFPTPEEMIATGDYYYPTLDGQVAHLTAPLKNIYLISADTYKYDFITPAALAEKGIDVKAFHYNGDTTFGGTPYRFNWILVELNDESGNNSIARLRELTKDLEVWVSPAFGKSVAYAKSSSPLLLVRVKAGHDDELQAFEEENPNNFYQWNDNVYMYTTPYDTDALTAACEILSLDFVEAVEPLFCDTWGHLYNFAYPL